MVRAELAYAGKYFKCLGAPSRFDEMTLDSLCNAAFPSIGTEPFVAPPESIRAHATQAIETLELLGTARHKILTCLNTRLEHASDINDMQETAAMLEVLEGVVQPSVLAVNRCIEVALLETARVHRPGSDYICSDLAPYVERYAAKVLASVNHLAELPAMAKSLQASVRVVVLSEPSYREEERCSFCDGCPTWMETVLDEPGRLGFSLEEDASMVDLSRPAVARLPY